MPDQTSEFYEPDFLRNTCQARRPLCERCPLTAQCDYFRDNVTNQVKLSEGAVDD